MDPERTIYIYALKDPRDDAVRYIGQSRDPQQRLSQHKADGSGNSKKSRWIRELRARGQSPILEVIEEATESEKHQRELWWIYEYLSKDADLTNNNTDILAAKLKHRPPVDWAYQGDIAAIWAIDNKGAFHLLNSHAPILHDEGCIFQGMSSSSGVFEGTFRVESKTVGNGNFEVTFYRASVIRCETILDLKINPRLVA